MDAVCLQKQKQRPHFTVKVQMLTSALCILVCFKKFELKKSLPRAKQKHLLIQHLFNSECETEFMILLSTSLAVMVLCYGLEFVHFNCLESESESGFLAKCVDTRNLVPTVGDSRVQI